MISCTRYENGDRINSEHEKTIVEKLLPFHPESHKKIGCGIDYITVYLSFPLTNSMCIIPPVMLGVSVD